MEIIKEENDTKGRLVAGKDGEEWGEITYSLANDGNLLIADHTGVKKSHMGQGVGKKLFYELVDYARKEGKKVMPLCPFIRMMFRKNEALWDVLRHNSL